MVELIKQIEDVPATYPDAPEDLCERAESLDPALIWSRIEAYTDRRYTPRAVTWILEGVAGEEFEPPLGPLSSFTASRWIDGDWSAATLANGPLGLILPSTGLFRVSGMVGAGDVPAPVGAAFRRLAEYLAGARKSTNEPGASSVSTKIAGDLEFQVQRSPAWLARAMQYSGAGELLRSSRHDQYHSHRPHGPRRITPLHTTDTAIHRRPYRTRGVQEARQACNNRRHAPTTGLRRRRTRRGVDGRCHSSDKREGSWVGS